MHAKREIQRTDSDREEKIGRIQGRDRGVEAKAEADLEVGHIVIIVIIIAITRVEEDNTREYGEKRLLCVCWTKMFRQYGIPVLSD